MARICASAPQRSQMIISPAFSVALTPIPRMLRRLRRTNRVLPVSIISSYKAHSLTTAYRLRHVMYPEPNHSDGSWCVSHRLRDSRNDRRSCYHHRRRCQWCWSNQSRWSGYPCHGVCCCGRHIIDRQLPVLDTITPFTKASYRRTITFSWIGFYLWYTTVEPDARYARDLV